MDAVGFIGPADRPCQVPGPSADVGKALGFGEAVLSLPHLLLHPLAFRDVPGQIGQRGYPFNVLLVVLRRLVAYPEHGYD